MILWKRFHPRILFFLGFLSFCIGIGFGSGYNIVGNFVIGYTTIICILIMMRYWKWQVVGSMFVFFVLGFGLTYMHQQERIKTHAFLSENLFSLKNIQITGVIERQMYTTDKNSIYRLSIDNFDTKVDNFDITSTGSIMVEVPKNLDIHTGNKIQFTGNIRSSFSNIFDLNGFDRYAWYHKLYGKSYLWSFDILNRDMPIPARDQIQESLKSLLFRGFPKEITAILLGITVGNTDFMSSELKNNFQNSGLTHILVVSGSNITFLILFLSVIIRYIPAHRYIKRTIIISFLLVYGYIVGWDVPVIRATIMGIIGYIALQSGYKRSVLAILVAIAWGILLFSPLALLYDAGFGLSFGATIGIIVFYSSLEKWISQYTPFCPQWCISIIGITLAASIGSFPVLLYHFGSYPLASILANIIIGGIIGPLLAMTILYILLSFFLPFGSLLLYFGYILFFFVKSILWTAEFFADFVRIDIPEPLRLPIALILISVCIRYILAQENKKLLHSK